MLIPKPNPAGSKSLCVWHFQNSPSNSSAHHDERIPEPQSKCGLLRAGETYQNLKAWPVFTASSPPLTHFLLQLHTTESYVLCWNRAGISPICASSHHCLLFLWLLKALCIPLPPPWSLPWLMLSTWVFFFPWGSHSTVHTLLFQHSPQAITL